MRIPTAVKKIIAGTFKIDPRDLLPRRVPYLRNRLAPPLISESKAQFYSKWLIQLGHNPTTFNLPVHAAALMSPPSIDPSYALPYVSPAERRVARELPRRLAKINFIKAQMRAMPRIIAEWREKRRANRQAKLEKYPY